MGRLLPLDAEPGPAFVAALRRAWDAGDAVLPLDPRLPPAARDALRRELRAEDEVADGDALVVATSGSTGDPKGVVLTHGAVAASAAASCARLRVDPATDRWLSCLPLAHIGGLSVITRCLVTGTPLTFRDDDHPTLTSMVPTQVERAGSTLERFRVVLMGGSADWRERPANVVHTYGMTETGSGIAYDGVALDGAEIRVDHDEIWVRGPMLLRCYRSSAGDIDPRVAGWLRTGDAGAIVDGRLHVDGRVDDVIVTGGEKVWPAPVEAVLRRVPGVADVAITGARDPEWGERVVAVVVPAAGADAPTLEALRAAVKEHLAPWYAPRALLLVDELPRTAVGKIRRRELRGLL